MPSSSSIDASLAYDYWKSRFQCEDCSFDDLPSSLQEDKDFILEVVDGYHYLNLPLHWQRDYDICMETLKAGPMSDEVVAIMFTQGPPALHGSLSGPDSANRNEVWQYLAGMASPAAFLRHAPACLRGSPSFMLAVICVRGEDFWNLCLPSLRDSTEFRGRVQSLYFSMAQEQTPCRPEHDRLTLAPDFIHNDGRIMKQAAKTRPWAFLFCSRRLQLQLDMIDVALKHKGGNLVLQTLPKEFLIQHYKQIIMTYLEQQHQHHKLDEAVQQFPVELWHKRDVVATYFKYRGEPHEAIPRHFYKESDIYVSILETATTSTLFDPWHYITTTTEDDDDVAYHASLNGVLYAADLLAAAPDVRAELLTPTVFLENFDAQLLTVWCHGLVRLPWDLKASFCQRVMDELNLHSTFVSIILPGVHLMSSSSRDCPLTMLNTGDASLLKLIAAFIGVPTDQRNLFDSEECGHLSALIDVCGEFLCSNNKNKKQHDGGDEYLREYQSSKRQKVIEGTAGRVDLL